MILKYAAGNKFEPEKPMSTMAPTIIFDRNDDLFMIMVTRWF